MANPIEILKQEHVDIERELTELETILQEQEINYPNLLHTLKKLYYLWDFHEEKEEKAFSIFEKEQIKIPVDKMKFDHKALKPHKDKLLHAINTHSDEEIKKSLHTDLIVIITKLRDHINMEDEILYTTSNLQFTPQELEQMSKIFE